MSSAHGNCGLKLWSWRSSSNRKFIQRHREGRQNDKVEYHGFDEQRSHDPRGRACNLSSAHWPKRPVECQGP